MAHQGLDAAQAGRMHRDAHAAEEALPVLTAAVPVALYIAAIYALPGIVPSLGYPPEWAGVTMLFALGIAMSLMFYVLIAGSSKD